MSETRPLVDIVGGFARASRAENVLAALHEHAVTAAGGRGSILYEADSRTGELHATSGHGVDTLPAGPAPASSPDASALLGTPLAVLLPLEGLDGPVGILAIGLMEPITAERGERLRVVAEMFVLALERLRLKRESDLQRDLQSLVRDFAQRVSSAPDLTSALEAFCDGAARLLGADRVSVWRHDRNARELALEASSDPAAVSASIRVPTDDRQHPAALALRRGRAALYPSGAGTVIAAGLKGRRRALGTLVFEGFRASADGARDVLMRAEEVARQLASAIDSTQLLEQVLLSRRELENTFNSLSDFVLVCDVRHHVVHVNQAFAARVGVPRHALAGAPVREFVSSALASLLAVPPDSPAPITHEVHDDRLGGTFLVTVTPLATESGPSGLVIVARDITNAARLEAERVQLRERLAQAEKLAALGQFIAGIAHELNNPLQAVIGHTELLRRGHGLAVEHRRDLRVIYREAERAARIVRNLLVFAGSGRFAKRRYSLNRLVVRVLALRGAGMRAAGVDVTRSLDETLPSLTGDPLMLQQALLNIVINAEQAVTGRPGGALAITTSWDAVSRMARVQIADNGPGLPAEVVTRVFEPFFTTKDVGQGTGLGLAIAYGIVQEHGGSIRAANGAQGGAVFTVEVPADV